MPETRGRAVAITPQALTERFTEHAAALNRAALNRAALNRAALNRATGTCEGRC